MSADHSRLGGEPGEERAVDLGFGKGGIPWYLLALYLCFLVFFVWYALEYQLPDYLEQGPVKPAAQESSAHEP
jgi:hypothetical protein